MANKALLKDGIKGNYAAATAAAKAPKPAPTAVPDDMLHTAITDLLHDGIKGNAAAATKAAAPPPPPTPANNAALPPSNAPAPVDLLHDGIKGNAAAAAKQGTVAVPPQQQAAAPTAGGTPTQGFVAGSSPTTRSARRTSMSAGATSRAAAATSTGCCGCPSSPGGRRWAPTRSRDQAAASMTCGMRTGLCSGPRSLDRPGTRTASQG